MRGSGIFRITLGILFNCGRIIYSQKCPCFTLASAFFVCLFHQLCVKIMSALMLLQALREWCSERKNETFGEGWSKNKILKVLNQGCGPDLGTAFCALQIAVLNGVKVFLFPQMMRVAAKLFGKSRDF